MESVPLIASRWTHAQHKIPAECIAGMQLIVEETKESLGEQQTMLSSSVTDNFDWAEKLLKSSSVESLKDLRKVALEGVKECLQSSEQVPNAAKPFFPHSEEMEEVFYISKESGRFLIPREWSRASTEYPSDEEEEGDREEEEEVEVEEQEEDEELYATGTPRASGPRNAGKINASLVHGSPVYERFDDWEIEEEPRISMSECEQEAPLERIVISGAAGANSELVNGQYVLQAASHGGKPCWRKHDNANIWLLSFPNSGKWYVTSTADKIEGVHAGWAVVEGALPMGQTTEWILDNGEEWMPQYLTVSKDQAALDTTGAMMYKQKQRKSHSGYFEDYGWKRFDAALAQRLVRSPLTPIHEMGEETEENDNAMQMHLTISYKDTQCWMYFA